MNRKISIILFGISFLIAILGESYLLNVSQPHIFSIIGIGIVVILTGYLFFDSIWEYISDTNKRKNLMSEEAERQDSEKWDSRYTELLNIQKATYAALKKSDKKMQEDIIELSERITQIIQLQNKAMDGQKKALNISLNYSREHTKELIDAIKEECKGLVYGEANNIERNTDNKTEVEKAESEIKPIYDDPNATLTADEISKLFENHGK